MRDDRLRLKDMAEAIGKIEKYISGGRQVFENDELVQIWVVYHLQILGDARGVSQESQRNYHQIPKII